jgi:hypothetical protein
MYIFIKLHEKFIGVLFSILLIDLQRDAVCNADISAEIYLLKSGKKKTRILCEY